MRTLIIFLLLITSLSRSQLLWQPQNSNIPLSEMVGVFSPVNDHVCWACTVDTGNAAPSGYIRTVDGGTIWAYGRISGAGDGIIGQIAAVDADTAYAAVWVWSPSNTAGVYKTTNGGSTWTKQNAYGPSTSRYGPGAIHFFDANNGVVVGTWHPETYMTSDAGQHWNAVSMPSAYPTEYEQSEMVFAGDCAWFVTAGAGARVFRTTNRGYTWYASIVESQNSNWFPCIAFQDSHTGIYSEKVQENLVPHYYRRTTDGGATWVPLSNSILDSIAPTGVRYVPGTRATYLIAGGMNSGMRGLAITTDAGDHWRLLDSSGALYLGFASDSVGWCSPHQHNNGVCKYVGPRLTSVEKWITSPPSYILAQNYPNPFNPSTTIHYALPHTSFVTLTVYNALGQQVAQLVNEQQQAGYHDVVFRGDGLASGVYFYRIQAGDFVSVKKLLLLK
jgi:photosystem II stability/assembly factor-like uncharacterized protein